MKLFDRFLQHPIVDAIMKKYAHDRRFQKQYEARKNLMLNSHNLQSGLSRDIENIIARFRQELHLHFIIIKVNVEALPFAENLFNKYDLNYTPSSSEDTFIVYRPEENYID